MPVRACGCVAGLQKIVQQSQLAASQTPRPQAALQPPPGLLQSMPRGSRSNASAGSTDIQLDDAEAFYYVTQVRRIEFQKYKWPSSEPDTIRYSR